MSLAILPLDAIQAHEFFHGASLPPVTPQTPNGNVLARKVSFDVALLGGKDTMSFFDPVQAGEDKLESERKRKLEWSDVSDDDSAPWEDSSCKMREARESVIRRKVSVDLSAYPAFGTAEQTELAEQAGDAVSDDDESCCTATQINPEAGLRPLDVDDLTNDECAHDVFLAFEIVAAGKWGMGERELMIGWREELANCVMVPPAARELMRLDFL